MEKLTELLGSLRYQGRTCLDMLRNPDVNFSDLSSLVPQLSVDDFSTEVLDAVHICARYAGYIDRQHRQVERFRNLQDQHLPVSLDYYSIPGLRIEARERLLAVTPTSLGQAARIPGINPTDIAVLMIYRKKTSRINSEFRLRMGVIPDSDPESRFEAFKIQLTLRLGKRNRV